jgi:hypothetical protein
MKEVCVNILRGKRLALSGFERLRYPLELITFL